MTQKPEYGIDLPQCMAERGELLEVAIEMGEDAVRTEGERDRARRHAVYLEQDAARGRELATAFILAVRSGASWGETEVAMDRLMEWVEDGDDR